jgi:hypothetical protein
MSLVNSRRFLAWWYVSIGAGFVALGVRAVIARVPLWAVGLRLAIGVGFLCLGALSWPRKKQ